MAENAPTIEQRLSALHQAEQPEQGGQPEQAAEQGKQERPRDESGKFAKPAPEAKESAKPEPSAESPQEQDVPAEGEDGGEVEEREITSLLDLVEYLGTEHGIEIAPEDVYNLDIPVTVGSESRMVKLGEWKDRYQDSARIERERQELQRSRETFEREQRALQQQAQQRLQEVATLVETAEKQLKADVEAINWNELYQDDPARFAAEKQRMTERQAAIEKAKADAVQRFQGLQQEAQQKQHEEFAKRVQKGREALQAALPEWRNPEKAKAEMQDLTGYLQGMGYTEHEVGTIADHRAVLLARKAMLYDLSIQNAVDVAKKKVVRVGSKPLKPGARPSKEQMRQATTKPLRDRLKKSGRWQDAAALLSERAK